MNSYTSTLRLLAAALLVAALAGCTSHRTVHIATHPGDFPTELAEGEPVKIDGFTRADGEHVEWKGYVRTVGADSLQFGPVGKGPAPKPATFGGPHRGPDDAFTVHATDVAALDLVEPDHVARAMVAVSLVTVGFLAAAYAAALSGDLGP